MAIITISRQTASLGDDLAQELAADLSYQYLDKKIVEESLKSFGFPEERIERYDEKKPGFWDIFSSEKDRYFQLLKYAMYDFASKDNCVLLGRGGQGLFKNIPGVIKIKFMAPFQIRVERFKKYYNCSTRQAEQMLKLKDNERDGFHKNFFGINWESDDLYDIVINTGTVLKKTALDLIKHFVSIFPPRELHDAALRRIRDLALAQAVLIEIIYKEHIPIQFIDVRAEDGTVYLLGSVNTPERIDECVRAAKSVPGVTKVVPEINVVLEYLGM